MQNISECGLKNLVTHPLENCDFVLHNCVNEGCMHPSAGPAAIEIKKESIFRDIGRGNWMLHLNIVFKRY